MAITGLVTGLLGLLILLVAFLVLVVGVLDAP
jgi:hypothetical protein